MQREIAIYRICCHELGRLSPDERESIILNWWSIDESDAKFSELPPEVQVKIRESEYPTDDSPLFDSLVLLGLCARYIGVKNEYLESQLKALNLDDTHVEGLPERLYACPCCLYRTLESRGQYYICPVCFWEDSGQGDLNDYSSPNRMTLAEAQSNFAVLGAISESALKSVDPYGREKWTRN